MRTEAEVRRREYAADVAALERKPRGVDERSNEIRDWKTRVRVAESVRDALRWVLGEPA